MTEQDEREEYLELGHERLEGERERQDLIRQNNLAKPELFNPEEDIVRATKAARALMKVVRMTKPLKLGGKEYLYFDHWQAIAKFFNASVGTEKVEKISNGWEAKAVVYQKGTIIGAAIASCSSDEKQWQGKPDFQLKSMAQTRAMAKALRSIFGYVAVLANFEATPAEELDKTITIENNNNDMNPIAIGTNKLASKAQQKYIQTLRKNKGMSELTQGELDILSSAQAHEMIEKLKE